MTEYERIGEACRMLEHISPQPETECISLTEAYGRVLAENITAEYAVTSFCRSAYDGYALRSADIHSASPEEPVTLKVTETVAAGSLAGHPVTEGTAIRIMTGAMMPEGADTVVKHEDTRFTEREATFFARASAANIIQPGEDVRQGELLAEEGQTLGAARVAALAAQGLESVRVYRRPEAAIFSTGSELVPSGQKPEPGKIRNTNPWLLGGYLRKYGIVSRDCGILTDDVRIMARQMGQALDKYDLLITTGGVSAGDFDFIPQVVESIGACVLFHRLPFKPGGAMLAARKDQKVILCLSGNPGAAATGMLRIGLPFMKRLCGRKDYRFTEAQAALEESYSKHSPGVSYLRGRAGITDGRLVFRRNDNQRNASVTSMTDCDLLAEIPPGDCRLSAGERVKVFFV